MKVDRQEDTLYLIPESDLIASRTDELRSYFDEQFKAHPDVAMVCLDVRGVNFVDSLGINLIVGIYRQVTKASAKMEIVGAGKNFMKVAVFFRLPSLFPITADES